MIKKIMNLILVVLIVLGFVIFPSKVNAVANPDTIILYSAKVFENVFEANDALLQVAHKVSYASPPAGYEVGDLFSLVIMNTTGTTVIASRQLNYYDYNINSIYFTAAQRTADLTWESAYIVRITANPAIFGTPVEDTNMDSSTLALSDWVDTSSLSEFSDLYEIWSLDIADTMETELLETLIVLVSGVSYLNNAGKSYWTLCTPGIDTVAGGLFQTASSVTTVTQPTPSNGLEAQTTISNKLGTSLYNAFAGLGQYLGFGYESGAYDPASSSKWAGSLFWLIICSTCAGIIFANSGVAVAGLILTLPFIYIGVWSGFIAVNLFFTVGIIITFMFGFYVFLRGL